MGRAALHPCGQPGCRAVLPRGVRYCDPHRHARHKAIDRDRGSAHERGYDAAWRKLRIDFLADNPLCGECQDEGIVRAAIIADHVVPISEAPERRLDRTNLRSMCKRHHDRHTARTQGFARGRGGGRKV